MEFAVVCIIALVVLGIVAVVASHFQHGDDTIKVGHDCSSCTSADDGSCQLHCLMEEKQKKSKSCAEPHTS